MNTEDDNRVKILIAGLVLAGFVIGYFILSSKFQSNQSTAGNSALQTIPPVTEIWSEHPIIKNTTLETSPKQTKTLPKTGFPAPLMVSFALSASIIGWSLRRYPN